MMKLCRRPNPRSLFFPGALAVCAALSGPFAPDMTRLSGACAAAENDNAQGGGGAGAAESGFARIKNHISSCNLHDARRELGVLEKTLAKDGSRGAAITELKDAIAAKEDSLVNRNLEILRAKGSNAAFQFMQDVVWARGVCKEKIDFLENAILNEETTRQQVQERKEIDRAVQLLDAQAPMDTAIDPYIVKTAEMMVKAREAGPGESGRTMDGEAKPPEPVMEPQASAQTPEPQQSSWEDALRDSGDTEMESARQAEEKTVIAEAYTPPPQVPEPPPAPPRAKVPPPAAKPQKSAAAAEEYISPSLEAELKARAEAKQAFLRQFKVNQEEAQSEVVDLYTMTENGRGTEAVARFKRRRAFIANYVGAEVFNVLEQTIVQSTIGGASAGAPAGFSNRQQPKAPEQESLDRIDGLLRHNRVEAAYTEFKRMEPRLKQYMTKKDFKMTKSMVEEAYKLRSGSRGK